MLGSHLCRWFIAEFEHPAKPNDHVPNAVPRYVFPIAATRRNVRQSLSQAALSIPAISAANTLQPADRDAAWIPRDLICFSRKMQYLWASRDIAEVELRLGGRKKKSGIGKSCRCMRNCAAVNASEI